MPCGWPQLLARASVQMVAPPCGRGWRTRTPPPRSCSRRATGGTDPWILQTQTTARCVHGHAGVCCGAALTTLSAVPVWGQAAGNSRLHMGWWWCSAGAGALGGAGGGVAGLGQLPPPGRRPARLPCAAQGEPCAFRHPTAAGVASVMAGRSGSSWGGPAVAALSLPPWVKVPSRPWPACAHCRAATTQITWWC